jgi:hypothetical protein
MSSLSNILFSTAFLIYNRLLGQGGHNELDDFFDPEYADSFLSFIYFCDFISPDSVFVFRQVH